MEKRIWLAALLGILIGVAIGYVPYVSLTAAPRTALLMQETAQPNIAQASPQPSSDALSILIALVLGVVIAVPGFVFAKRQSS